MPEKYTCFICGFNELDSPPTNYSICPACGTEFGYDDGVPHNVPETREKWFKSGMKWWAHGLQDQPKDWNPTKLFIDMLLSEGLFAQMYGA